MKTAGDILSALFDERFVKKAHGYSKFFDSWKDITEKNGIASAADHSRIKDLDKGIVLIETDHPGWKQIIQTKQSKLLNDFRIRFPQLDISGISLILGNQDSDSQKSPQEWQSAVEEKENVIKNINHTVLAVNNAIGLDAIKDEEFRETLKKLGQTIAEREKK